MELCGRNVRLDRSAAGIVGRGFRGGKSSNYIPSGGHGMNYPVAPHGGVPGDFYMFNRHPGGHHQQFMALHGAPPAPFAYPGYHPYMPQPGSPTPDANNGQMHPPAPFMMGYPTMMVPPGGVPPPPPTNGENGHYSQQQAPPPPPPVPQSESDDRKFASDHHRDSEVN